MVTGPGDAQCQSFCKYYSINVKISCCRITAKSRYSAAYFISVTQSRRPMARPLGRDMGRLLWVHIWPVHAICNFYSRCHDRCVTGRVISAIDCMSTIALIACGSFVANHVVMPSVVSFTEHIFLLQNMTKYILLLQNIFWDIWWHGAYGGAMPSALTKIFAVSLILLFLMWRKSHQHPWN